jgi:prephenate dehydratase
MYADLEFEKIEDYHQMMIELQAITSDLKVLGEYKQGEKYL